jgi:hypothetical protein
MDLNESIIELHNIARLVEQQIGKGLLAEDIRKCADRLADIISLTIHKQPTNYDTII